MKKISSILFCMSIYYGLSASDLNSVLLETVEKVRHDSTVADHQQSIQLLERLPASENWYIGYYTSFSYILMARKEANLELRDKMLDNALEVINKTMLLSPENDELYALLAFALQIKISVDPGSRGARLSGQIMESLGTAESINSNNPRIYFLRGMQIMNMPKMFGGGAKKALPVFEQALGHYWNWQSTDLLQPTWGAKDCQIEFEICKAAVE